MASPRDWFDYETMMNDVQPYVEKAKNAARTAGSGAQNIYNANVKPLIESAKGFAGMKATPAPAPSVGTPLPEMAAKPTANIGETIAQAAKGSNLTEAEVLNPSMRNAQPGINQTISQVQGETSALRTPQAAAPAQTAMPNLVQQPTSAGVQELPGSRVNPDGSIREPVKPASVAEAPKPKVGMRGMAGGLLGRAVGVLGLADAGMGAYDAIKETTPGATYENRPERALKILAGLNPFRSMMGGEAKAAETPPTQQASTRSVVARPPQEQAGAIQTDQGPQSPTDLMKGTAVPQSGSGAFQRTGGQARGLRFNVGDEAERMRASNSVDREMGSGNINAVNELAKQGPGGALAALGAFGAGQKAQMNEENLKTKSRASELARAKFGYDIAKDQRDAKLNQSKFDSDQEKQGEARNDAVIEARARTKAGDPSGYGSVTGAYENTVKNQKADMSDRYRHTLGNMGTTMGKASEKQIQGLHLLDDIRTRTTEARKDWAKKYGSDFFGNKQKDSRDLNDFQPDHYEPGNPAIGVSKWIVLKTGEKIPVTAGVGGNFNIFGPNDPMDKQLLEMADMADKKYKAKGK